MSQDSAAGVKILRVSYWEREGWLIHGFSTRLGGAGRTDPESSAQGYLNLGFTANDHAGSVARNRRSWMAAVLNDAVPSHAAPGLVTLKQMHSGLTRTVGKREVAEQASLWGDGLVTGEPGVLLGIQTADCLPVLVADKQRKAVGAFHAGWRGTLKGVVQRGVKSMKRAFESNPEDLTAAIGPGIRVCCLTVGTEVRKMFSARYSYADELFLEKPNLRLDLVEANRRQLLDAGLQEESIFTLGECTSCRTDLFFSHRAEHGKTGRMMAAIGIAER